MIKDVAAASYFCKNEYRFSHVSKTKRRFTETRRQNNNNETKNQLRKFKHQNKQ